MWRNWILKLCTEPCEGVDRKRCRNMYLANLLIHMQSGKLEESFLQSPYYVDISDALQVFGGSPCSIEPSEWLNDTDLTIQHKESPADKPGRTYIANRTLPNGQGAFAYVGISLPAGDTSMQKLDAQFGRKLNEEVPQYEMEKILAKQKNPQEREKVSTFYDTLLQIVADELNCKAPEFNETVEGLLEQLIEDLKAKGQYNCCYDNLDDYERRMELLMTLYDRIKIRRDKVACREEILDDIEEKMMPHLFEVSEIEPDDEYQLPAAMFVVYLAALKEEIAERTHTRHERIATQMKKELRKESTRQKKDADRMEQMCLDTEKVYKAVTEHWKKKQVVEEQNRQQFNLPVSEHTRLYEELKEAALDTRKLVEEEAARGKFLTDQINSVAEQGETVKEIHEDAIKKCEHVNGKLLRNIKRLNHNIKLYETRISDIKNMGDTTKTNVKNLIAGVKESEF
ncbi:hypothetical protein YQE_00865, partial [Dendroctonus ponderosae]